MSRIGKKPIPVPQGVKVAVEEGMVRAEGPKGKLSQSIPSSLSVTMESDVLTGGRGPGHRNVRASAGPGRAPRPRLSVPMESDVLTVARSSDHRNVRALHGLTRSLLANMVTGVKDGFERKLEIVGIGYRCQLQGKALQLALGYSHPIVFPLPEGIQAEVDRQVAITPRGAGTAR